VPPINDSENFRPADQPLQHNLSRRSTIHRVSRVDKLFTEFLSCPSTTQKVREAPINYSQHACRADQLLNTSRLYL
jgi:hypothetical protein